MSAQADAKRLYGLLAEFGDERALVAAARAAWSQGYRCLDAYSPFPVHGLSDAIGFHQTRLPLIVLAGGLSGAAGGFLLQYWASAVSYPLNIGGRPLNSWPAFLPVTFELAILGAALSAVGGMLALNQLPRPYHPLFNAARFGRATRDRFFLCIEARDPAFDRDATCRFLAGLEPSSVVEVEP
jgi:hypothetical protein